MINISISFIENAGAHVISPLYSILLGSLITLAVSYFFYYKAGKNLEKESKKLIDRTEHVLNALERSDLVEFVRDEDGEIVQLKDWKIKISGIDMSQYGEVTVKTTTKQDKSPKS